ncbi:MAG TPA: hypothetical protein VKE40_14480 [Gemmataceae bacterium]|nr:hypothetical protein [Gemmataceae bacterium]
MHPITIRYPFRPVRRSLATGQVADLFGLGADEPPHIVAENVELDIRPGDLVLVSGPSGSGKSSLLREAGRQFSAVDAMKLKLPDVPLVDALSGPVEERLGLLAACGLSEARLVLRTPAELSDGQRYRFRLAFALGRFACGSPLNEGKGVEHFVLADEFAANLDRTLARVLAFNARRLVTRTGVGMLLATTHDDMTADLRPDLRVQCLGDGVIRQIRDVRARDPRPISFAGELRVEDGSVADWEYFARWHYRSHRLAFVKRVVLLKRRDEPIGICVLTAPAAALGLRTRYFGLTAPRSRVALSALNEQLWLLSRVVLHPTYRGAGLAAGFVREACRTCPVPWIETLTAMGHANPIFDRAGFVRVGVVRKPDAAGYGGQYGPRGRCNAQTMAKGRYSEPVYYVFDNRR